MTRRLQIARVVLFLFACAAVLAFAAPLVRKFPARQAELILGGVTGLATFALTALFVRWERLHLADVGAMPNEGSIARLALGFLIGFVIISVWAALSVAFGHAHWVRANDVDSGSIALTVLAYLSLACREELAFRGYPLRRLHQRFGLWTAQFIVAFVFALEHKLSGETWVDAFLGAGVGSLVFGMAAIATQGLAVPIGLHAAWNLGHWALGLKGTPGLWRSVIDERHQQSAARTAIFLYDIVMLSAAFAFWLWHRRSRRTA